MKRNLILAALAALVVAFIGVGPSLAAPQSAASLAPLLGAGDQDEIDPQGQFLWKKFGGAPFASSREEAMKRRAEAFKCLGVPKEVAAAFMAATEKPGERSRIVVGDHLDAMLSTGCVRHDNVVVAFAAPVHNMEYAAPGERWEVEVDGVKYVLFLPDICNNWSVVMIEIIVRGDPCVELDFDVPAGSQVRVGIISGTPLPPSSCYAKAEDTGAWQQPPTPCDSCDWMGPMSVAAQYLPSGEQDIRVQHSMLWTARGTHMRLRFPKNIDRKFLVICITDPRTGRQSNGTGVTSADWATAVKGVLQIPKAALQLP